MFSNRRLGHIYAILVIDVVAASVLGPLLNQYISDLPAKAIWLTGGTALMLGIQLATAPTMGNYADKDGRRRALIFSTIGSFLTTLLLLPVQAWGYVANRIARGVTNGQYSVLRSAITDVSDKEDLIKTASMHSFVVGFGSILGPMVGGLLLLAMPEARRSPVPLVIMALLLTGLNVGLAFRFKETNDKHGNIDPKALKTKAFDALKVRTLWDKLNEKNAQLPGLKPLFILNIVATFGVGYYPFFVAFLSQSRLKMEPLRAGYFFIYFGALSCLTNLLFFRYVADRVDKRKAIAVCALAGAGLMGLYAFAESSPVLLYVAATIDALTVTLIAGLTGGLLSKLAAQGEEQGEVFGEVQALGGLAGFVTALIVTGLSGVSMQAPFVWCGVCLAGLGWWTLRLPEETRAVTQPASVAE